ncbi:MAG: hypothetical protein JXB14_05855 [Candidatus Altiarchaeota archaeon]|nr:hypothetical protein [Candidatus Altiarchaeota archaeon]
MLSPAEVEELKKAVKSELDSGKAIEQVKSEMMDVGYSQEDIDSAFSNAPVEKKIEDIVEEAISAPPKTEAPAPPANDDFFESMRKEQEAPPETPKAEEKKGEKPPKPEKPKGSKKKIILIIIIIAIVAVLSVLYFMGFLDSLLAMIGISTGGGTTGGGIDTGGGGSLTAAKPAMELIPEESFMFIRVDPPWALELIEESLKSYTTPSYITGAMIAPAVDMDFLKSQLEDTYGIKLDSLTDVVVFMEEVEYSTNTGVIVKGSFNKDKVVNSFFGSSGSESEYKNVKVYSGPSFTGYDYYAAEMPVPTQTSYSNNIAFLDDSTLAFTTQLDFMKKVIDLNSGSGKSIKANSELMEVVSKAGEGSFTVGFQMTPSMKQNMQTTLSYSDAPVDLAFMLDMEALGASEGDKGGKAVLMFADEQKATDGKKGLEDVVDYLKQMIGQMRGLMANSSSGSEEQMQQMEAYFDIMESIIQETTINQEGKFVIVKTPSMTSAYMQVMTGILSLQMGMFSTSPGAVPGMSGFGSVKPNDWACNPVTNELQIIFINGAGQRIENVSIEGGSCEETTVMAGDTTVCTIEDIGCGPTGLRFEKTISISYKTADGFERTSVGTVWGPAE